jgi:hypothetical protein
MVEETVLSIHIDMAASILLVIVLHEPWTPSTPRWAPLRSVPVASS